MGGGTTPMADLVTALTTAVSTNSMLSTLTDFIPVVGAVLIFAFTYRVLRRVISGASKGKARI